LYVYDMLSDHKGSNSSNSSNSGARCHINIPSSSLLCPKTIATHLPHRELS